MRKIILSLLFLYSLSVTAQENLDYQLPSASILSLADYERPPAVSMSSSKEYMLFSYRSTYKTLQDLNIEDMRLAGLRINPKTNISSTVTYISNLKIRKVKEYNAEPTQVSGLPNLAQITNISWSPDETKIAFTHTTEKGVELWIIDVASAVATKITKDNLNANIGSPYTWFRDSKNLLVKLLPANKPALIDAKNELPKGPVVSLAEGTTSQNRTYADLLKNKIDEDNFSALVTSELYKININGSQSLFLPQAIYTSNNFSPDGNYIMISTVEKPFSYIVPYSRFPQSTTVYDANGKEVKLISQLPLMEVMPKGFMSTYVGKRNVQWRADKPATLFYVETLDGGDQATKVEFRDELFLWEAPFNNTAISIGKTPQRFSGITWGNDQYALVSDNWYDTRNRKTYIYNPSIYNSHPPILHDRNYQDQYSDPGSPETKRNEYGRYVLAIENGNTYWIGAGYSKEGQFPFIDELNLKTQKTKRLYHSTYNDKKEDILSVEDFKNGIALVQLQSQTDYPNYYFRNFKKKGDNLTQITFNKNPFESIKDVYKEVIQYKREDGVDLSGTLYLPAGYDRKKKEKLPLLVWAYPREYKDRSSAGQVTLNANDFTFPSYGSFVYWVTKGYAVLDNATFPIIGEGDKEPNDSFIEQLVANGKAAIDAVDALGYIDRKRVGVGGHSYGAFMTANLLSHSDLFACGIARSGAYNRTLTPFGFQTEQRNYWDVPEIYNGMSPFMNAHKMKKPILLLHGEADNNPGTHTMQTERYFQALKGLGANARMVILPKESHGYVARESILHTLWEQEQFLDKYLKP